MGGQGQRSLCALNRGNCCVSRAKLLLALCARHRHGDPKFRNEYTLLAFKFANMDMAHSVFEDTVQGLDGINLFYGSVK